MIVYRTQSERADPVPLLGRLQALLQSFEESRFASRALAVELLIDFGALEAAVADALSPDIDSDGPLLQSFRQTGLLTGRLFYHSAKGARSEAAAWAGRLGRALDRHRSLPLPNPVELRLPEGYAYYALYPESYLSAAERFFHDRRPDRAVCIGVRSIGTSLSSVVSAALEARGCEVRSLTLRPRGHPFDRSLSLSPLLEEALRRTAGAHFLIIDEGPGLSGSSFACIARKLSGLGIADDRIVFFPSWEGDETKFLSEAARACWPRHRKYTVSFEEIWTAPRRLISSFPEGRLLDLSGGNWRALFYSGPSESPPVQPQHERRKYLSFEPAVFPSEPFRFWEKTAAGPAPLWMKFAGLGRYGRLKRLQAERLAEAGFAPAVLGLENGFLITRFVAGAPLSGRPIDSRLLDTMARYLAFRNETLPGARSVSFDAMTEMIRVNTREGLGEEWADSLAPLESFRTIFDGQPPIAIDGRMLPQEWLRTGGGDFKTDGIDHHDDHFFPGCQEIAWDLAGTSVEFALDRAAVAAFIDRYRSHNDDKDLLRRLPFYTVAYLAYRLGYAALAAGTLGPAPEGEKFKALGGNYAFQLREAIGRL
jgi:hypothetical protein